MLIALRMSFSVCLVAVVLAASARAAAPTVQQALDLKPTQDGIEFDKPAEDEIARCRLDAESQGSAAGWVVRGPTGLILRRFLDTNGDNKLDQWCYYKNGVEVFRDVDADFNGKADQYRWLGIGGMRWGLDQQEDGKIDSWKMISAEEVTAEVVAAFRDKDLDRFKALLLTPEELKSLGLSEQRTEDIAKKITTAVANFKTVAAQQQIVGDKSQWINFGGTHPGVAPAGLDGSTKDVIVYENVTAVVETAGNHAQVAVGTLVKVGDVWRIFDLPQNLQDGQANAAAEGFFFAAASSARMDAAAGSESGLNAADQKLIAELEQIDKDLARAATLPQQANLNSQRADVLEKLVNSAANEEDRAVWVRQFADTVSAAVQAGGYPDGVQRLEKLYQELQKNNKGGDYVAYVKFRHMAAAYGQSMLDEKADFAKVQEKWLSDLQAFVEEFPTSPDSAEAMLQLAIAQEFAGEEEEAKKWYGKIVREFPRSEITKKAAGAQRRLESVGRSLDLRGKTADGKAFDLSRLNGRVVLLQYWATWCEPCKQDMVELKKLQAKYGNRGFTLVGVSLDSDLPTLNEYVRANRISWTQLYEEGGLDSRLANELGILTLPTMLLIDKQGKVISRNIHVGELDAELQKHVR